jgi:hypothetical protein
MGVTEMNLDGNVSRRTLAQNCFVLVIYGTKKLETRGNLLLGAIRLDDGADDGHIYLLRADIVH